MEPAEIDKSISFFFNSFTHTFPTLDHFIYMLSENKLLKGGLVLSAFYYLWWSNTTYRSKLIITVLASFLAEVFTIIASLTLPYRARPFTGKDIDFNPPVAIDSWWNNAISSFPSDHATLFTVFGIGVYTCDKKIGRLLIAYIALFIFLPRIYLGLHYLTDIIAGILIGLFFYYLMLKSKKVTVFAHKISLMAEEQPRYFYPILFLISYNLADLFTEAREILGFIRHPLGIHH